MKNIEIRVVYELETEFGMDKDLDETIESKADEIGGEWTDQGSGEYRRDIAFDFESREKVGEFIQNLPGEIERVTVVMRRKLEDG